MEEWKKIPGYDDYYISNQGIIKSNKYNRQRILNLETTSEGYYRCTLSKDGKTNRFHVHKLVAEVFISNPENKKHVRHIDFMRKNNDVGNLEWCTQNESIKATVVAGRHTRGSRQGGSILHERDIPIIRDMISKGYTNKQLGSIFNICHTMISKINRGRYWTHV